MCVPCVRKDEIAFVSDDMF